MIDSIFMRILFCDGEKGMTGKVSNFGSIAAVEGYVFSQIITSAKVVVCSAPIRGYYWLCPSRSAESLAPHYIHLQPLKRLFFFIPLTHHTQNHCTSAAKSLKALNK